MNSTLQGKPPAAISGGMEHSGEAAVNPSIVAATACKGGKFPQGIGAKVGAPVRRNGVVGRLSRRRMFVESMSVLPPLKGPQLGGCETQLQRWYSYGVTYGVKYLAGRQGECRRGRGSCR